MGTVDRKPSLQIGDTAKLTKVFSEQDVVTFAEISSDYNPVHVDEAFAARTRFGRRIVHGMLTAGLISAVLGTQLPGPGCIYLNQILKFQAPVYPGDTITATVEVIAIREDKPIVTLAARCTNQDGVTVLEGDAVLLIPPQ